MSTTSTLFEKDTIREQLSDGYWIDSFDVNGNGRKDIIAYGLNTGVVRWYENPNQEERSGDWKERTIAQVHQPVGMSHGDINGNGIEDMVICCEYGDTMVTINEEGGLIFWLENPRNVDGVWKKRYIGRATGMHRLCLGYFTQTTKLELLALPIVGKQHNTHSDLQVKLFQQPDDLEDAFEWKETLITDTFFHVIHDVAIRKFRMNRGDERDSAILASQEGVTWLYYDGEWNWKVLFEGVPKTSEGGYWGCHDLDVGRIGDDPFAYIVAAGPFHGNVLMLYVRTSGDMGTLENSTWKEYTLAIYGNNEAPLRDGNGPIHYTICADMDGDGNDEFLVALRDKGVKYFKIDDLMNGKLTCKHASDTSAARITVADFNGDRRLDFATIGYAVAGYYEADKVELAVFYNKDCTTAPTAGITFSLKEEDSTEVKVDITPDATLFQEAKLLSIFHFTFSVVHLPANVSFPGDCSTLQDGSMVKVLSGKLMMKIDKIGSTVFLDNTIEPLGTRNMRVNSYDRKVHAVRDTIFLLIVPDFNPAVQDFPLIESAEEVNKSIRSLVSVNDKEIPFQFSAYNNFWNMSGFSIRLLNQYIAHLQFWLADRGINCGFHDHDHPEKRGDKAFCEIHGALINGTGNGGMYRSRKGVGVKTEGREDCDQIIVPSGYEHGPLWNADSSGRAVWREEGSISYPYHAWIAGKGDL